MHGHQFVFPFRRLADHHKVPSKGALQQQNTTVPGVGHQTKITARQTQRYPLGRLARLVQGLASFALPVSVQSKAATVMPERPTL